MEKFHMIKMDKSAFPEDFSTLVVSIEELIFKVCPNIADNFQNTDWLCERAILAPRNETVQIINQKILQDIPKEERTYLSNDTTVDPDKAVNFPIEFLNSLDIPGMPSHKLVLK